MDFETGGLPQRFVGRACGGRADRRGIDVHRADRLLALGGGGDNRDGVKDWFSIALTGRAASGRPFTPMLDGDMNGDGLSNDRAFIFSPTSSNAAIAEGMSQLIGNASSRTRKCLLAQVGTIAGQSHDPVSQPSEPARGIRRAHSWFGTHARLGTTGASGAEAVAGHHNPARS
ncbi:MAG: hypothetical protein ABJE10_03270 [bacterium]